MNQPIGLFKKAVLISLDQSTLNVSSDDRAFQVAQIDSTTFDHECLCQIQS